MKVIQDLTVGGTGTFAGNVSVPNGVSDAHAVNKLQLDSAIAGIVGTVYSEIVTVDFGASYTDKTEVVLTGKSWVSSTTAISAHALTPIGMDADEMYLYRFYPVISNKVNGVGFTLTVYSEIEYTGIITIMIIAS